VPAPCGRGLQVRQQPRNGTGTQAGHTPHDRNDERWRCRWCGGWREDDGDDRCRLAGTGRRRTATLAWAVAGLTMVALVAAVVSPCWCLPACLPPRAQPQPTRASLWASAHEQRGTSTSSATAPSG
jgi:hypothetical protein